MRATILASAASLSLALVGWAPAASADSAHATCELRKDGETKANASGPCTFSQRQGHIDIDLRNGTTYSLSPANKPDQFKDDKGHKVVRTKAGGDRQEYRWDNKKLTVTFGGSHDAGHGHGSSASGDTPRDLRDLVDGKLVGGEVDDELTKRGYRHINDSQSGDDVWSNWKNTSSKDCVTVHFDKSRHVRSIVNSPDFDCSRR